MILINNLLHKIANTSYRCSLDNPYPSRLKFCNKWPVVRDNSFFFSLYWNVTLVPPQSAVTHRLMSVNKVDALIVFSEPHSATHSGFSSASSAQSSELLLLKHLQHIFPEAACFSQISQEPARLHAVSADPTHKHSLTITRIQASWRTWNIWDNPLSRLSADTWKEKTVALCVSISGVKNINSLLLSLNIKCQKTFKEKSILC